MEIGVLIIGGGSAGLTAACFYGTGAMLVEACALSERGTGY